MARRSHVPAPRTPERRQLILELLAERAESGESYRELAERSGIPEPTLAWWQKKLRDEDARSDGIDLVEVESAGWRPMALRSIEIVFRGGVVVRVPEGVELRWLQGVLDGIDGRC
jgi:transposase-like protein